MAAAMGIGRFVYTPILPMMVAAEGLSASQAGMIASSNFLGHLVGAMVAATPVIRGSVRVWLLATLLASALSTLAMAGTDSYTGFLLVRFVGGMVSAMVLVFATSLVIVRLASMGRGELTAVLFGGVGLGIILASLLTWLAVLLQHGWRGAWINSGVTALIATVAVALLVPGRRRVAEASSPGPGSDTGGMAGLLVAYGLFGFGYIITATYLVQLVRSAAYSQQTEILVWVLVGVTAAPSVWMWNRIAGATGIRRAYSMACVALAIGVAASVLLPGLWGLLPGAVLLGGTFMGITALGLAAARNRSSRDARHALGMMTAAFGLGQIIGPVVAGVMRDLLGSFLLPSLLASALLLVAALLVECG